MKQVIYYLLCLPFFTSCNPMGRMYSTLYAPPIFIMPEHIKKIGIVNRSLPVDNKGNKTWSTLEAIVSGEGINEDRNGSFAAMSGAEVQFNMDTIVKAYQLKEMLLPGQGAGRINPPLNFDIVDTICRINGFDALLVLEGFDTDQRNSQTLYAIREVANMAISGNVNLNSPPPSWTEVLVKMNWRFYDNHDKIILDEAYLSDYFGSNKNRYDVADFAKRDGIQYSSYIGGRSYINRLYPSRIRVFRNFFRRSGPELKMAARMLDVGDFAGARRTWEGLTVHHRRKIAGRACYNTAVGYELAGELEKALEWCQKSYTVHRIKEARNYSNFIIRRMNNLNLR